MYTQKVEGWRECTSASVQASSKGPNDRVVLRPTRTLVLTIDYFPTILSARFVTTHHRVCNVYGVSHKSHAALDSMSDVLLVASNIKQFGWIQSREGEHSLLHENKILAHEQKSNEKLVNEK